jgi:hypothetical protein
MKGLHQMKIVLISIKMLDAKMVNKLAILMNGQRDHSRHFCLMESMLTYINLNMKDLEELCAIIRLFINLIDNLPLLILIVENMIAFKPFSTIGTMKALFLQILTMLTLQPIKIPFHLL